MIHTTQNWAYDVAQYRKQAVKAAEKYKASHKGMKQVVVRRENGAIYLKWEK